MASEYSQIFTLTDIFGNKNLKNKLPMITYEEKELGNGKFSYNTKVQSVKNQVFETATSAAMPFYKPLKATKSGDTIQIDGTLVGSYDSAYNAICNAIQGIGSILTWTANNVDMIREAIKESLKNKRNYGNNSKLYLKVQSMQQIQGMTKKEIEGLMSNIMENIVYGDNFPETQKKFKVDKIYVNSPYNYEQRKLRWKYKVGDV